MCMGFRYNRAVSKVVFILVTWKWSCACALIFSGKGLNVSSSMSLCQAHTWNRNAFMSFLQTVFPFRSYNIHRLLCHPAAVIKILWLSQKREDTVVKHKRRALTSISASHKDILSSYVQKILEQAKKRRLKAEKAIRTSLFSSLRF